MAPATKGTSNHRVNKNFYLTFSLAAQAKERTAPLLLFLLWLAETVMAAFARAKDLFGLGAYGIGFTVSRSDGKLVSFAPQGISRFDEIIPFLETLASLPGVLSCPCPIEDFQCVCTTFFLG